MLTVRCRSVLVATALVAAALGCSDHPPGRVTAPPTASATQSPSATYSYIVVAKANAALPESLETEVRAAGGTIVATIPQIGLAVVESVREDLASVPLTGVESIVPDLPITAAGFEGLPLSFPPGAITAADAPPIPPGGDPLSGLQWGLRAIKAPEAWAAGYTGRGVRVAVLDAGIQSTHPDLAPNLNKALSTSFVPGQTFDTPPGPHGTQVAGIIAAARNGMNTVGVAPNAELVAVKILPAANPGPISRIAQGLVYAADIGARIANISAGINLPRATQIVIDTRGTEDPADDVRVKVTHDALLTLMHALARATNYAHAKGVLIIAAAGNIKKDFDHAKSDIGLPQELPHVVTIGPTGPVGWALDHDTDLDVHPSYANFGQSYIHLAAPGGNFDVFTRPGLPPSCTLLTFTSPCQVFDLVLTTNVGSTVFWNFGGSFAAPHAAGVAALVMEKLGPSATPDQVEAILRITADDIGKPGNDDYFGHGRINAWRAVTR